MMIKNIRELSRVLARRTEGLSGEYFSRCLYSSQSDIQVAAGVPPLRTGRKVVICAPGKTPMQSGSAQTLDGGAPNWRISLETEGKWTNPLMGWTSTADASETVSRQLYFATKEDAIAFAQKHGMEFTVEEPAAVPKNRPKTFPGYGSNFDSKRLKGGKPIGGLRSELPTKK